MSAREGPNTATRKPHEKQPYPDFHIFHRHSPPPGSWDGPEWSIFGYICLKNIAVESAECLSILYQDVMVCSSKAIRLQSVNKSTGTWGLAIPCVNNLVEDHVTRAGLADIRIVQYISF